MSDDLPAMPPTVGEGSPTPNLAAARFTPQRQEDGVLLVDPKGGRAAPIAHVIVLLLAAAGGAIAIPFTTASQPQQLMGGFLVAAVCAFAAILIGLIDGLKRTAYFGARYRRPRHRLQLRRGGVVEVDGVRVSRQPPARVALAVTTIVMNNHGIAKVVINFHALIVFPDAVVRAASFRDDTVAAVSFAAGLRAALGLPEEEIAVVVEPALEHSLAGNLGFAALTLADLGAATGLFILGASLATDPVLRVALAVACWAPAHVALVLVGVRWLRAELARTARRIYGVA